MMSGYHKGQEQVRGRCGMDKLKETRLLKKYYTAYQMDSLFSKAMIGTLEIIKFSRLEYICKEEAAMEQLIFLVEGKAKVFKSLANGKSLLISFYTPFEVIGDLELVKDRPASCTVQAISTCYGLALPMKKAREELSTDCKFLRFACASLAKKLDYISINSSINLLYPLEKRLASYINTVAVLMEGSNGEEYLGFNENLTYLAELLGTSYRHLLRTLNDLCARGVIHKEKEGYRVVDKVHLNRIGDLY